jgi:tetratricopeptide (TPR) repeat protein
MLKGLPPRYEPLALLGEGAFGIVYKVRDHEQGGQVALKWLKRVDPAGVQGFKREFRELRDLRHTNLVALYELEQGGEQWWFTMELVEGGDWLSYVHAAPPGEQVERIRSGLVQILDGLSALHAHGRVHRDLKPSNVLVTEAGRVLLADFGLVAQAEDASAVEGRVVGTVGYMAPEQAAGAPPSPEADVYSLGVMLYETLTGRLPFEGDALDVLLRKGLADPVAPRLLVPHVDEHLEHVCLALMQRDPRERPIPGTLRKLLVGGASTASLRARAPLDSDRLFVGRVAEQAALERAFAAVRAGQPRALLVHGPSGIGKTALLARFVARLREQSAPACVLIGACRDHERVAFKAVEALMEPLARQLRNLPEAERVVAIPLLTPALTRLFPALLPVSPHARVRHRLGADVESERPQAFRDLRALLVALSRERPVVLLVEDLQWADPDSHELLSFLCAAHADEQGAAAFQLLLLGTGRRAEDASWASEALALGELSERDAHTLVATLSAGRRGPDTLDALVEEGHGHPLFLRELCRLGERPQARITLEEVLGGRLDELDAESRDLLEVLAVAADALSIPVLQRSVSCSPERLRDLLFALRRERLIAARPWARAGSSDSAPHVELHHLRLQEVLVTRLPEARRVAHHAALARALADVPGSDPLRVAHHHRMAGERAAAIAQLRRTVEQATASEAFALSAAAHRELLGLVDAAPPAERAELWRGLGEALSALGRSMEAVAAYETALALGPAEPELLRVRAARHLLRAGHLERGRALIEDLLQTPALAPARSEARAMWNIVMNRLRVRRLRFAAEPVAEARNDQAETRLLELLGSLGSSLAVMDQVRGFDYQLRYAVRAMRTGHPDHLLPALFSELLVASGTEGKDPRTTDALLGRLTELAARSSGPNPEAAVLTARAFVAMIRGQGLATHERALEALDHIERHCRDVTLERGTVRMVLLWGCVVGGLLREQAQYFWRFVHEAEELGDLYTQVSLTVAGRAWPMLLDDDVGAARRDVERALEAWPQRGLHLQHLFAQHTFITLDMYEHAGTEAFERVLRDAPSIEKSMIMRVGFHRSTYERLVICAGLQAWTRGDARAPGFVRTHLRRLGRLPDPLSRAHHHRLSAGLLLCEGRLEAAASELGSAIAGLDQLGSHLERAALEDALGRITGGDEGRSLRVAAQRRMAAMGVRRPEHCGLVFFPPIARL